MGEMPWGRELAAETQGVSKSYLEEGVCVGGECSNSSTYSLTLIFFKNFLTFIYFLKKIFFFNVYLFLGQRETEHEQGRGRERGRHRIGNRLQALSHQPRA